MFEIWHFYLRHMYEVIFRTLLGDLLGKFRFLDLSLSVTPLPDKGCGRDEP